MLRARIVPMCRLQIFWSKDGREINRETDSNLILANDGSLIISATRITDSGNYTCEARNLANRRISDPAEVVVYGTFLFPMVDAFVFIENTAGALCSRRTV